MKCLIVLCCFVAVAFAGQTWLETLECVQDGVAQCAQEHNSELGDAIETCYSQAQAKLDEGTEAFAGCLDEKTGSSE